MMHSIKARTFSVLSLLCLAFYPAGAWPREYQPLQEIRQVATEFLKNTVEQGSGTRRVQIGQIDSRLRLPICRSPLVPFLPAGANPKGNIAVGVRCSGPKRWKLYVSAKVTTYDKVVVLTRNLPRHSKISAEDVRLVEHDITDVTAPLVTKLEEAIGKKLTRSLPADLPLTYSLLRDPIIIHRGQRVTLLYRSPGIEVRGTGTALGNGSKGEHVSARPPGGSRAVAGVVLRPGIILVNQN
jgi:flagella basal body P-ring formation protein FlgA